MSAVDWAAGSGAGERAALARSAVTVPARLTAMTDKPVLIGAGVSNPDNTVRICGQVDGVIIGVTTLDKGDV